MMLLRPGRDGKAGPQRSVRSVAARCAGLTLLLLPGGVLLGVALAVAAGTMPVHAPASLRLVGSMIIGLTILTGASVVWARLVGRQTGCANLRGMGWAAAVSFGPTIVLVGLGLTFLEGEVLQPADGPGLPMHAVFGALFVPAAFLVTGVTAFAIGTVLGSRRTAMSLAVRTGIAAAAAFLGVDMIMDAAGWRVGAPGAEDRATMVTVMMLGILAASVAGGGALGASIFRRNRLAESGPTTEPVLAHPRPSPRGSTPAGHDG